MTQGCRFRLLLAILLVGCSGQAPPASVAAPQIYDFTSEGTFPAAPDVAANPAGGMLTDSAASSELQGSTSQSGWRVQIFTGKTKRSAIDIQQQWQSTVPETVYVDYVEPYYKVFVGNCAQRESCEILQQQLRSLGNESAWVVPHTLLTAVQP